MKSYLSLPLLPLLFTSIITSQTPEQSYFEWTSMPFSKEQLAERRLRFMSHLPKNGLVFVPSKDGFSYGETFRQLDDFYYFTGLEIPNAILVLDLSKKSSLIYTPERDLRFESASRPNDFPGRPLLRDSDLTEASGIVLKNKKELNEDFRQYTMPTVYLNLGRSGGVEQLSNELIQTPTPEEILMLGLRRMKNELLFKNYYEALAKVRMVKSESEIAFMRKATEINVEGIKVAAKAIEAGKDERYLEGVLEGNYKKDGAQRLAFGSIIKSGPNSLWPWRILATHYDRRNRIMEDGDVVIFDVGCEYNYYVSDVGRTFPVSGTFTPKQREILAMEVNIADQIIAFIKPGITFKDLRDLCDRIIPEDAKKYMQAGLFFGHHLGLSTGDPNLSDATLEPGMIFTVEPWYYNHDEQISVFTEDVILVTKDGCEVLSKDLPRTPKALEALMKE
ncbi:MAG: Xaa-Pro peptidase family protein [Maribacter sp.]